MKRSLRKVYSVSFEHPIELVPQGKVVAHIHRGFWRDAGTHVEYPPSKRMRCLKVSVGLEPDGEYQGSAFVGQTSSGKIEESVTEPMPLYQNTSLYRCVVGMGYRFKGNGTYPIALPTMMVFDLDLIETCCFGQNMVHIFSYHEI